jgi:hypothetical protein
VDSPHQYEMSLKKDGLFIHLSSDDVYFISRQMDKWFRIMLDDSYVPVPSPKRKAAATPITAASPPPIPATAPAELTSSAPAVAAPIAQAQAAPEPILPNLPQSSAGPEITPHVSHPAEAANVAATAAPSAVMAPPEPMPPPLSVSQPNLMATPATESIDAPPPKSVSVESVLPLPAVPQSALPETSPSPAIHEHLTAEVATVITPVTASVLTAIATPVAPPIDDFEAIMNTVMQDLDEEPASSNLVVNAEEPTPLENIASLSELCDRSNAQTTQDFLLLAAYYLTTFEQEKQFSLKRLNSSLVKSGLSPVNHSALETALQQGVLSMVPDLTGTAEVSEYQLTDLGGSTALKLF